MSVLDSLQGHASLRLSSCQQLVDKIGDYVYRLLCSGGVNTETKGVDTATKVHAQANVSLSRTQARKDPTDTQTQKCLSLQSVVT